MAQQSVINTASPKPSTDIAPPDVSYCLLLSLPSELRREIWSHCLRSEHPIKWPQDISNSTGNRTALLRTCKFVYREAAPLLYRCNTLLFKHPSDCNMFLSYHKMKLAKQVRSILFHIQATEYMLWTGYFNSSFDYRSLKADYPKLKTLNIVMLNERTLRDQEITAALGFQQWRQDKAIKNICHSLLERVDDGLVINMLYLKLSTDEREMQEVLDAYPRQFVPPTANAQYTCLRTLPNNFHSRENFKMSLDATAPSLFIDNPWITEKMFHL